MRESRLRDLEEAVAGGKLERFVLGPLAHQIG